MSGDPGLATFSFLGALADPALWWSIARAIAYLIAGLALSRAVRFGATRALPTLEAGQRTLLARLAANVVLGLFVVSALRQFGFDLTVLLGAAGIVTVAVGFASQTSASNLIAGLFLILERAVQPGDVITVGGRTGEVISVDLLSTKLRTFDNLLVRIPNETMVKTEIVALNRFAIRRVDLPIGVGYATDLPTAEAALVVAARRNPLVLDEPAPQVFAQGFGADSVEYLLTVWTEKGNFVAVRNALLRDVKAELDAAGIEIPFPQRTLSTQAPLQVEVIRRSEGAGEGP
jgi:small-conductance mechanosensitive channel